MEYVSQTNNTYITDKESKESLVYNSTENSLNRSQTNEMRIFYLFPPRSAEDAKIKREVNAILTSALREQLQKQTS